ncbi:MAG: hypothetical protein OXN81_22185, partial [Alphaproteobacteria bacterium]|nr:hypothetical protein [Alphaproteobacteria bacterium]
MLETHGRYYHSSIVSRPVYDWPDGNRLAVYVALNVEVFAWGRGKGAGVGGGGPPRPPARGGGGGGSTPPPPQGGGGGWLWGVWG